MIPYLISACMLLLFSVWVVYDDITWRKHYNRLHKLQGSRRAVK